MKPESPTEMLSAATACALIAARDCGLLAAAKDSSDPAALARHLSLDPTATERVLNLLALCDCLDAGPDVIEQASRRVAELDGMSGYVWDHLPRFLGTGETLFESLGRPRAYSTVTPYLATMFEADAERLAARLPCSGPILDVGAGSGVWSLAMAQRDPLVRVTALDFDPVLARFRERAASLDLADRAETIAGSYFDAPIPPRAFDRIVVANVLHLETPERARTLLERLAPGLRPGGAFLICDTFSLGSLEQERARAAYALHLALRVRGGYPHRQTDVQRWLTEVGARDARLIELPGATRVSAVVVARSNTPPPRPLSPG